MDIRLELVVIPVTDIDAAKAFYVDQVGFHADHDHRVSDEVRFVQLTPPGSACSIAFGQGLLPADAAPVKGLQVVVDDIEEAHRDLSGRGCPVTDVDDQPWGRFVYFSDPDGNSWSVQQLPPRS
jgi:catechol 2,3-dioxygenase-like lactoylglutathione lyase family enzyme